MKKTFKDYIKEAKEASSKARTIADVLRDKRTIEQGNDGRFTKKEDAQLEELSTELASLMAKVLDSSKEEIEKNIAEIKERENSVSSGIVIRKLEAKLKEK